DVEKGRAVSARWSTVQASASAPARPACAGAPDVLHCAFRAVQGRGQTVDRVALSAKKRGRKKMKSEPRAACKAASKLISERIAELGDWRGETLAKMRALIHEADPEV